MSERIATGFAALIAVFFWSFLGYGEEMKEEGKREAEEVKPPVEFKRPAYQVRRFEEDWSGLAGKDRNQTGDVFDVIKFVPLSEDEKIWAGFGGQLRFRLEQWDDFQFLERGGDDVYLLTRVFVHGELNIGEYFRAFIQGKSAFATDRDLPGGRRGADVDELELHNAFAELRAPLPLGTNSIVSARFGRQELQFGKERLVSPLDWSNSRRIFDGISGNWQFENDAVKSDITAFWTRADVPVQKYSFNDVDDTADFFGAYATGKLKSVPLFMDLFWMTLDRDNITFSGVTGRMRVHTIGGRLGIKDDTYDFDIEAAWQFGDMGGSDIEAYMVTSDFAYNLPQIEDATPNVHIGFGYATGDHKPGRGNVRTFNFVFPLGHAWLGWMDFIGRQNIIDLHGGFMLKSLFGKLTFTVNGHAFWLAEEQDNLYNSGGGIVRRSVPGASSMVGYEIDTLIKFQFDRHLEFLLGYSHFFPGDFIQDVHDALGGGDSGSDFVYLIAQYTF